MVNFSDRKIKGAVFDIGGVVAHDVWEGIYFHPSRGLAAQHSLDMCHSGTSEESCSEGLILRHHEQTSLSL